MNEAARRATSDDEPALRRLADEVLTELTPQRGGRLWASREARPHPPGDSIMAALGDARRVVVVGTIDRVVVGYGVAHHEDLRDGTRLGVVEDLFVEPEARGVGVGEAMMELLVAWCVQQRCHGVDALALPGNRAAKNFFERFGLTARAIVVHRDLTPEDAP